MYHVNMWHYFKHTFKKPTVAYRFTPKGLTGFWWTSHETPLENQSTYRRYFNLLRLGGFIPPLPLGSTYLLRVGVLEMTIRFVQSPKEQNIHSTSTLPICLDAMIDLNSAPWATLVNDYLHKYALSKAEQIWHGFCAVAHATPLTQ